MGHSDLLVTAQYRDSAAAADELPQTTINAEDVHA
jgi:hypothetical protein